MTDQIRPSEISDVLLSQLRDIDMDLSFEEVGKVLQVSDGVVRIHGLLNAEAGELLEFEDGIKAVVMNLEEDNVGAVLLGPTTESRRVCLSDVPAGSLPSMSLMMWSEEW